MGQGSAKVMVFVAQVMGYSMFLKMFLGYLKELVGNHVQR